MPYVLNPQTHSEIWYHGSSDPFLAFNKFLPMEESGATYLAVYLSSDRDIAEDGVEDEEDTKVLALYDCKIQKGRYFKNQELASSQAFQDLKTELHNQLVSLSLPTTDEALNWMLRKIQVTPFYYFMEATLMHINDGARHRSSSLDIVSPIFQFEDSQIAWVRTITEGSSPILEALKSLGYEGFYCLEALARFPSRPHPSTTLAVFYPERLIKIMRFGIVGDWWDPMCRICREEFEDMTSLDSQFLCEDCRA